MDEYVDASDPRDRFAFMLFDRLVALETELERQRAELERQRAEIAALRDAARFVAVPSAEWLMYCVYVDRDAEFDMAAALAAVEWLPGSRVWYGLDVLNPADKPLVEGVPCVRWTVGLNVAMDTLTDNRLVVAKAIAREIDARARNGRTVYVSQTALSFSGTPAAFRDFESFEVPAV